MAFHKNFEPVRASLLHRVPLPTLEQATSELISEETRLGIHTKVLDSVLATPQALSPAPAAALVAPQSKPSAAQSSSSCVYCYNRALPAFHSLAHCPVRECLICHKTAPGHLQHHCPMAQSSSFRKGSSRSSSHSRSSHGSRSTAAAASEGSLSPAPTFSMTDVESIIQQVLAKSGTSSSHALSVTPGT